MAGRGHKTVLILGGTAEANRLAEQLADAGHYRVITSLAGRTNTPVLPRGEHRQGGFGGVDGFVRYLATEDVDMIVDATHPFATQMSNHAAEGATRSGIPCVHLARPEWPASAGDNWILVQDEAQAAAELPAGARAFLALGRQYLEPFAARNDVDFVIRMVDPPTDLPMANATVVLGKPSEAFEEEQALFDRHGISHVVARNSGGRAGYGKIEAARNLSLPVVVIVRPPSRAGDTVATTEEAVSWVFANG